MNNNAKKYWVFALVVILLPFGLYWVIKQPCGFTDIGGDDAPKEWLSFWSNYLGALISSIAAFIILGVTYNQNRKENRLNRELQIQAIMQQQERDRMLQLRKSCTIYSNVFDVNEFIAMVEEMKVDSNITNEPDLSKFIVSYILTYTNCSKVLQTAMQVYFRFENERVTNIFKRDEN